jgi:hypothetical protein
MVLAWAGGVNVRSALELAALVLLPMKADERNMTQITQHLEDLG